MPRVLKVEKWFNKNSDILAMLFLLNFFIPFILKLVYMENTFLEKYLVVISIGLPYLLVTIIQGYHQNTENKIKNEIELNEKNFNNFLKERDSMDKYKIMSQQEMINLKENLSGIKELNHLLEISSRFLKIFSLLFAVLFFFSDLLHINDYEKIKVELQTSNLRMDSILNVVKELNDKFDTQPR